MDTMTAWNGPTWRLRVQLADRPGALAKLTTRLAERNCNVLALSVLPVPGGVVDDLVVRVPAGMLPADLVAVVQANGGHCVGISRTDRHDLVDGPTAALRTAARTIGSGAGLAEALRALLGADSVSPTDIEPKQPEAVPGEVSVAGGAHQATIRTSDGNTLLAQRGWAPFTTIELARASALAELVEKAGVPTDSPRAVLTTDGAGIVLRAGRQGDEDALAAMHTRYSTEMVAARYQHGKRSVPNRVLHRLVTPPKGRTIVAVCGTTLVAVAQLISTDKPKIAEIALLVDEGWQQRGVGTALLRHLAATARAAGITELFALSTAGTSALARTAARAGMATSTRWEEDLMRVSVSLRPLVEEEWDRSPVRR